MVGCGPHRARWHVSDKKETEVPSGDIEACLCEIMRTGLVGIPVCMRVHVCTEVHVFAPLSVCGVTRCHPAPMFMNVTENVCCPNCVWIVYEWVLHGDRAGLRVSLLHTWRHYCVNVKCYVDRVSEVTGVRGMGAHSWAGRKPTPGHLDKVLSMTR